MDPLEIFVPVGVMENALGKAIRAARKMKDLTLQEVGDAIGVSAAAVSGWERGINPPTVSNLTALFAFLDIDPAAAHSGEAVFKTPAEPHAEVERVTDNVRPDLGPMNVQVLGLSAGAGDETEDEFFINGEVIDLVRRPPGIANAKNVFALHIIGTSMVPRYEPGDMIYCGGRAPTPGDYVVIEMKPEQEGRAGKSYIKKFVRREPGRVVCEQFNPPKERTFDTAKIERFIRVIPMRELMGF